MKINKGWVFVFLTKLQRTTRGVDTRGRITYFSYKNEEQEFFSLPSKKAHGKKIINLKE